MSMVEVTRDGHVVTVRLNRPDAMNAISGAMADELTSACADIARDRETWAVIVAAAGRKAFCVGADLKERADFTIEDFQRNRQQIRGLFAALRAIPQPTIAAVFGYALGGGCEAALSCDLIVASDDAQLGLPEASVGLLPAGGGTQLLARRVGPARAKEMIFTARRLDAAEALAKGVVDELVPFDELGARSLALAQQVCRNSPVAVQAAKQAIDSGFGRPLGEGIEVEQSAWEVVIASEDRAEGIEAFNAKRAPGWQNR